MKKLYVLQYSVQQQCFQVTSMHNTIEINVGVFLNNSPLEYIPILYSSDKMVLLELTEKLTNIRLDLSHLLKLKGLSFPRYWTNTQIN